LSQAVATGLNCPPSPGTPPGRLPRRNFRISSDTLSGTSNPGPPYSPNSRWMTPPGSIRSLFIGRPVKSQNRRAAFVSPTPTHRMSMPASSRDGKADARYPQYSELSNSPSWGRMTTRDFVFVDDDGWGRIGDVGLSPVRGSRRDDERRMAS